MLDVVATSHAELVPGTSNPGFVRTTPGGVGRNIAENLARLGTPVDLVTAIGDDLAGEMIRERCTDAGVGLEHVVTSVFGTGTYTAILHPSGEMSLAACDAAGMDGLTVADVEPALGAVTRDDLVVVDANVPPAVAAAVLTATRERGVRCVLDVVSYPKAVRLRDVVLANPPWLVAPNLEELVALLGRPVALPQIGEAARELVGRGIEHVWARLGPVGSVLAAAGGDGLPTATEFTPPPVPILDVTGAGDALTAGFLHALLGGASVTEAAAYGHRVSALTLMTNDSVRADLSEALVAAGVAGS